MNRGLIAFCCLLGIVQSGCRSTAPVEIRTAWHTWSTAFPGGTISWEAPDSETPTYFGRHVERIEREDPPKKGVHNTLVWWKGYDVNSEDYPAFAIHFDIQNYLTEFSAAPSFEEMCEQQAQYWKERPCSMDEQILAGRKWLKITIDYYDKATRARHVLFRTPIDRRCFLTIRGEYDNEARKDMEWFAARQSVLSNVVASVYISTVGDHSASKAGEGDGRAESPSR